MLSAGRSVILRKLKNRYLDHVEQAFDFPTEDFELHDYELRYYGIDLMGLIRTYGAPIKFHYLPKIQENITNAVNWFESAMEKIGYDAQYHYSYCTKSSHFSFVIKKVLDCGAHLETSSAYDLNIVTKLVEEGLLGQDRFIICNGFKTAPYYDRMIELIHNGYNLIPVIDNFHEADALLRKVEKECHVGIRIAAEEEPKFAFYTSRLGVGYKDVFKLWLEKIEPNKNLKLKMLHFFINTGIKDTAYYWNELRKCIKLYCRLKKYAPSIDTLNIGGGFPIKHNVHFKYDYQYMVEEILTFIKNACEEEGVDVPHIATEFGTYTVGESGATLFEVIHQKKQNDRERWNMINGSFMNSLPDTWAINQRFILFPLNRWDKETERVLLGGLSCDSDDYYNSEQHTNAIFLPKYEAEDPLYIGFFNTGAYQENIGGYGGIQHCLLPGPKHLVLDRDKDGELTVEVFSDTQSADSMLSLLGY